MANSLEHLPSKIVQQLLVDLGLGTLPSADGDWPVHVEDEPDEPDDCVTVRTTAGVSGPPLMPTGELSGSFGFQVTVRAAARPAGWLKADAIQTGLAESVRLTAVTLSGAGYRVWQVTPGDVLPVGTDEGGRRHVFTINCTATINMTA